MKKQSNKRHFQDKYYSQIIIILCEAPPAIIIYFVNIIYI